MRKGQIATVTNEQLKMEMTFAELVFGTGKAPSFTGEILAVNPTASEFATFNENFKSAVEEGYVEGTVDGVIYYDNGAERAFIVDERHISVQ